MDKSTINKIEKIVIDLQESKLGIDGSLKVGQAPLYKSFVDEIAEYKIKGDYDTAIDKIIREAEFYGGDLSNFFVVMLYEVLVLAGEILNAYALLLESWRAILKKYGPDPKNGGCAFWSAQIVLNKMLVDTCKKVVNQHSLNPMFEYMGSLVNKPMYNINCDKQKLLDEIEGVVKIDTIRSQFRF